MNPQPPMKPYPDETTPEITTNLANDVTVRHWLNTNPTLEAVKRAANAEADSATGPPRRHVLLRLMRRVRDVEWARAKAAVEKMEGLRP